LSLAGQGRVTSNKQHRQMIHVWDNSCQMLFTQHTWSSCTQYHCKAPLIFNNTLALATSMSLQPVQHAKSYCKWDGQYRSMGDAMMRRHLTVHHCGTARHRQAVAPAKVKQMLLRFILQAQ
jgi:uncharacterized protein with WD repeat